MIKAFKAFTALSVGVALSGCGGTTPASDSAASAESPIKVDNRIEHVHNVTVLDDRALLLGTHAGLWRQDAPGEAMTPVGEPFDVMGFTTTPYGWLASGHPAGGGGPSDLGLLESVDEGRSWTAVSLSGQVDFHRLTQSNKTVLGANSGDGRLWSSKDRGETWRTLGPAPFDIALDPQDPRRVVGTTPQGLVVSKDRGQTWRTTSTQPALAVLGWGETGLYGVSVDGVAYSSADSGMTWESRGTVQGQPEAISVGRTSMAVIAAGTLWESTDGGRTFDARITGIPQH